MKKLLFLILPIFLMVGCSSSPTFSISPIGDKFTNPNQPKGFVGDGNRLSNKSSMGGVHIDKKGVYINPYVFKNDGGEIVKLGFSVTHMNFEYKDLFRPIQSIVFLGENNQRVEIKCTPLDIDVDLGYYNPISNDLQGTASEQSDCECDREKFETIISLTSMEAKINGGELSTIYEAEKVSQSFLTNLKSFYNQQMNN